MHSITTDITIVLCAFNCEFLLNIPDHLKSELIFHEYDQSIGSFSLNFQSLNNDLLLSKLSPHIPDRAKPSCNNKREILDFKLVWMLDSLPNSDIILLMYQLHKWIHEFNKRNLYCRTNWNIIVNSHFDPSSEFGMLINVLGARTFNFTCTSLWNKWLLWKGTLYWNCGVDSNNNLCLNNARIYSDSSNLENYLNIIKIIIMSSGLYLYKAIPIDSFPIYRLGPTELTFTLSFKTLDKIDLQLDHCWMGYFYYKENESSPMERIEVVLLSFLIKDTSNDSMDIPIRILGNVCTIPDDVILMHHKRENVYENDNVIYHDLWYDSIQKELGYLFKTDIKHCCIENIVKNMEEEIKISIDSTVTHQPLDNPFISDSLSLVKHYEHEKKYKHAKTDVRRRSLAGDLVVSQENNIHNINKTKLRRCILLSLKRHKIDIYHSEFTEICKSLYNNVCFVFRKEFKIKSLSESQFFPVIDSSINSLNIT